MTKTNSSKKISGIERFQQWTNQRGLTFKPVMLEDAANTAVQAASALGCDVAHIAKSLIFRGAESGEAVLVIASGVNRVDEKCVAKAIGENIVRADAAFVREVSGYAIGGVSPFAHAQRVRALIDRDLLQHKTVWAAAGHPKAVFEISPAELARLTAGEKIQIS